MLDTEQISRLDAGYTAHSHILEMIESGQSIDSIRRHCSMMKRAAEGQLKLLLKDENEIDASDATEAKHDAYADVRESHASDLSDTDLEHTSSAALEKITSDGNNCIIDKCQNTPQKDSDLCKDCLTNRSWAIM